MAPEEIDIEENHLLPKQGNDLIPHIESDINHTSQAAEKSNPNEPNWKRIEAAFRVLNILNSKDDSYYYAFISVKNKNENGYRYKYIKFKPNEEAKSGAEDDMLYTYTETSSESDDINLFLLAQIPNSEMALQKVRSWYNTGTTEPSNNSENRLLMNSSQACSYEDEVFCFSTGDPDMPYTCWHIATESCPSEELEEEDGSGVGASYEPDCYGWDCEPIDPTGGGGSYDPDDPNEDPTDTECPGEDEGEDHGQDEGNLTLDSTCNEEEEDPCEEDNPPLYCECEDTGNVVFDNQTFKMGLEDLWNKQLDSNKEQGSFFYENELTGDWQFFELIEPWVKRQTLTRLEFSVPSGLPEGSIYIHTHPTRSSLENYGITNEYIHGPSDDDRAAMVDMNNKHGVEYGVIIDPDYRILIGSDGNEITRENRCGY
ncbi:MAG: hypothetical protein R6V27_00870 [Balneolaceae bacterium]